MKKRLLSAFLAVMMVLTMAPVAFATGTEDSSWSGEGTEMNPYQIKDVADLRALSDAVAAAKTQSGKYFKLEEDIDMSSVSNWTPIGNLVSYPGTTFSGTFDGNGKTISNLTVSDTTSNHATAGLFGSTNGTIKNLTLKNVNVTSTHYAGGIVAYSSDRDNHATIENCHVDGGTITSTPEVVNNANANAYDNGDKVGGIVGYCVTGDTIANCSVKNVTITAYRDFGGIVGCASGTVRDCTVGENVKLIVDAEHNYKNYNTLGQHNVNSIIGRNLEDATVSNCTGTVTIGYKNAAAKIDVVEYPTLTAAIENVDDNATITLLKDVTENVVIPADKTVTLDLNGKTLTGRVTSNGNLTIEDSTAGQPSVSADYKTVTYQSGKIYNQGTAVVVAVGGKVTLKSGTIQSGNLGVSVTGADKMSNWSTPIASEATIEGGYIVAQEFGAAVYGNGAKLNVNGGVIVSNDNAAVAGNGAYNQTPRGFTEPVNYGGTTINIAGGTMIGHIKTAGYIACGVYHPQAGVLNITGGTIYADNGVGICIRNGELNVSGDAKIIATGNESGKVGDQANQIPGKTLVIDYSNGYNHNNETVDTRKINVSGGYFSAEQATLEVYENSGEGTLMPTQFVSGGYFSSDPSDYLAQYTGVEKKKYVAGAINESPYFFRVALVDDDQIPVVSAVGATAAPSEDDLKKTGMTEEVAKAVAAAAQEVAAGDTEIKEAVAPIATGITDAQAEQYRQDAKDLVANVEKIGVRAYLEVKPTAYDADTAYTLDITPKYDVVVVGTKIDGTTEAEKVVETNTLNVTKATEVSVRLPAGFVSTTDQLYVQHKGHEYNANVTNNNGVYTATFTNPHGFSPFTISKTTQTVATIGTDRYTSFADAVNAVPANGTIEVTGGTSPYTGTANKTFTVKNSTTNPAADIVVNGQTIKAGELYTFKYTSSSSGGSSSGKNTFKVVTSSVNNGGVNASPSSAEKGATITITLSPDKGYKLGTLTVTDGSGKTIATTKKSDTVYTFTMPASKVDVKASFTEAAETSPFGDVSTGAYYYEAVKWAVEKGITNGKADGLFGSNDPCTRAQIVTFLWRAAGSPEPQGSAAGLTDVVSGSYYEKAVAWAIESGITNGTTGTTFSPNTACTRAQAVTFLFRAAKASASGSAAFSDVAANAYYAEAVKWATDNGITNGIGSGLFGSGNTCTRAQIVTFLWRFYTNA